MSVFYPCCVRTLSVYWTSTQPHPRFTAKRSFVVCAVSHSSSQQQLKALSLTSYFVPGASNLEESNDSSERNGSWSGLCRLEGRGWSDKGTPVANNGSRPRRFRLPHVYQQRTRRAIYQVSGAKQLSRSSGDDRV